MPARNYIELVEKTLRVLETMAESGGDVHLKDIVSRVGLTKSSAFRILFTLKELGYVEQVDGHKTYRLSPRLFGLARKSAFTPNLINVARPYLVRLRDEFSESSWLGQVKRGRVILVAAAEAPRQLRLSFEVGEVSPLHATGVGKAIAAQMTPAELDAAVGAGELKRFTPRTIPNRSQLDKELAKIRQQGFSVNQEETVEGAILVGAPIFDSLGRAFAAISVSSPTVRWSAERRLTMSQAVKQAASSITADL
ncbi:MAG: IclR family transcriptional regulator, partial [Burkholderiales bacterium]